VKIFSLPKYQIDLKEWGQIIATLIFIIIVCGVLYDGCVAIRNDDMKAQHIYEQCTPVCYPNPVFDWRLTPDGECRCNTTIEYRK
jgi:hypothetical protein